MNVIGRRRAFCLVPLLLVLAAAPTQAMAAGGGKRDHRGRFEASSRGGRTARRKGTKHPAKVSGERPVEGSLSYELTPASSSLPVTQTISLFLPGGVRVAGASMKHCDPAGLEHDGPGACPKQSLLGSGTATGWTLGQLWPLTLTLYNGPGGNLLSYVTASTPVKIETIVPGTVSHPGGSYGVEIVNTLPAELLEPLPGDPAQTVNLRVHINGSSGWLRSTNCAPHALAVNFRFNYTNGQTISIGGALNCLE